MHGFPKRHYGRLLPISRHLNADLSHVRKTRKRWKWAAEYSERMVGNPESGPGCATGKLKCRVGSR
jgi:hypothetical protein